MLISAHAGSLPLADESVQCVVTSPPYWGLRKYAGEQEVAWLLEPEKCAFGLEPTVEMYVTHTLAILREMWRVLRADGVCFWNLGDSYANDAKWGGSTGGKHVADLHGQSSIGRERKTSGLKPKDLCLIPARVAIAAQADGWWVRSLIIWAKPNPMPESVSDRPTDSYEHIIMLTKSERYFWDADAVREPAEASSKRPDTRRRLPHRKTCPEVRGTHEGWHETYRPDSRNMRNVWTFPTQPYAGAHFATFPEEIPRRCIKAATKDGDLVLDPFGGSGTTGRVAIELRRRAVLCDLAYGRASEEDVAKGRVYHELADRRTRKVQIKLL